MKNMKAKVCWFRKDSQWARTADLNIDSMFKMLKQSNKEGVRALAMINKTNKEVESCLKTLNRDNSRFC